MAKDERAARREARTRWPGKVGHLQDLPENELVTGSPAQLLGMVRELTLATWAMSGRKIPDYERAVAPGRLLRARDGR